MPPSVLEAVRGCDLVLHAGDLTEPAVLDELRAIAPVVAVQGNHDREAAVALPRTAVVEIAGVTIGVVHGDRRAPVEMLGGAVSLLTGRAQTLGLLRRVTREVGDVDVAIFGHLHETFLGRVGGTLVFSPGGVYQPEIDHGFSWTHPLSRALRVYRRRLPPERVRPSVGVLDIADGRVDATFVALPEPLLPTTLVSTRCHDPAP